MPELLDVEYILEDAENCTTQALIALKKENFKHVLHFLQVIKKHLSEINDEIGEGKIEFQYYPNSNRTLAQGGRVMAEGCEKTDLPTLDDYDQDSLKVRNSSDESDYNIV